MTWVTPCHCSVSESSQVFYFFSLVWLCIVPDFSPSLPEMAPHHFIYPMPLLGMDMCQSRCPTSANLGSSAFSLMCHHHSVLWFHIGPCVPLLFPGIALCSPRWPTASHWDGSALTYISHLSSLRQNQIITGVLLPLFRMAVCHFRFTLLLTLVLLCCFRCITFAH